MNRGPSVTFLVPTIALSIVYGLLPVALWKEPLYDGLVTSAVVAIAVALWRRRPAADNQWGLVLVAMVSVGFAEWIWFANDLRGIAPFPSWGEVFDLAGRAVLLVALARLSARRGRLRDCTAVIDAAAIGLAVSVLSWLFVFRTYFGRSDLALAERMITLGYLVLDISLLVGFLLLLLEARRGAPALRLLATGIGLLVAGDLVWLTLVAHDSYVIGHMLDAVWPVSYCLIAAAALHPTMKTVAESDTIASVPSRLRMIGLPCMLGALPAADVVLEIRHVDLSLLDHLILAVGTIVLGAVVAARFLGLMRFVGDVAEARSAYRTEALIRESLDIIAIVGADGLVKYVSPPLERVLGWTIDEAVGRRIETLAVAEDRKAAAQHFAAVINRGSGEPVVFRLSVMHRSGASVPMEIACVNRVDDPEIAGVIVSARDISERDRLEQEVEYHAFHDRLTGLANRSLLLDHVGLALRQRDHDPGAVFMIDLDDFQSVNDGLGHAAGDELLVAVAERLRTCIRPGDTVARLGGDEFAVFMNGAERASVDTYATRILEVLRLPLRAGTTELAMSASIGIRVVSDGDTAQLALRDADIAMYSAKRSGKARHEVYDTEMGAQAARRVALMADLRGAWHRGEISVHYQPIVTIPTGALRGAEALVRWTHPLFGSVSPAEFVAIAEETGIIRELGLQIMREAVTHTTQWREVVPDFYISVNVSPVQLDAGLPDVVDSILAAAGLDPTAMLIEITEGVVLSSLDESIQILEALRARGMRIAIDDFGTGYSSLSYARQLPVDLVKIDRSFTSDLDSSSEGLIPTIMQLARTLRTAVVAEGVETIEQLTELERLECRLAQGYLFSPPVPSESFTQIARRGVLAPGGPNAAPMRRPPTQKVVASPR